MRTDRLPPTGSARYLGKPTLSLFEMSCGGSERRLSVSAVLPRGVCAEVLGVWRGAAAVMAVVSLRCRALRLRPSGFPCWPLALCRKSDFGVAALICVWRLRCRRFLPSVVCLAKIPASLLSERGVSSQHVAVGFVVSKAARGSARGAETTAPPQTTFRPASCRGRAAARAALVCVCLMNRAIASLTSPRLLRADQHPDRRLPQPARG